MTPAQKALVDAVKLVLRWEVQPHGGLDSDMRFMRAALVAVEGEQGSLIETRPAKWCDPTTLDVAGLRSTIVACEEELERRERPVLEKLLCGSEEDDANHYAEPTKSCDCTCHLNVNKWCFGCHERHAPTEPTKEEP